MKKLLLLTSLFLAFAFSKDDDNGNNSIDPLIGTWSGTQSFSEEIDGETITASVEVTMTFNADGRGTQVYTFTFEGETEIEREPTTWSNSSSNPNFSSTNQSYSIGGSTVTIVFSSNFQTATVSGEDDEGEEIDLVLTKS